MINTKPQNIATEQNQDDSDKKSWFKNELAWGAGLFLAVPIAIAVAPVAVAGLGLAGGILATTAIGVGLVAGGAYLANSYEEKMEDRVSAKSRREESEDKGNKEGAIERRFSQLEKNLGILTDKTDSINTEIFQLRRAYGDLDRKVDANKREQDKFSRNVGQALNYFTGFFNPLFEGGPAADVNDMLPRFNAAQANHVVALDAAAAGRDAGLGGAGGDGRPADDAALGIGHPPLRRLEPNEGNLVAVLREGGAGGGGDGLPPAGGGDGRGEGDPAVARDAARAAARAAALAAAAGDGGAVRPGGGEVGSAEAGGGGDGLLLAGGSGAGADAAARRRGDKPSEAAVPDPAAAILLPDGHGGVGGRRAEAPDPAAAGAGGGGGGAEVAGAAAGGGPGGAVPGPAPGRGRGPATAAAATGNSAYKGV